MLAYDFRDILNPRNAAISIEDLAHHKEQEYTLSKTADDALKHIISFTKAMMGADKYSQAESTKSQKSWNSPHSTKSNSSKTSSKLSEMVAIKRAKAVEAHAKLEFEEQISTIKKKQAQLDEQENLAKATAVRKKAELEADL